MNEDTSPVQDTRVVARRPMLRSGEPLDTWFFVGRLHCKKPGPGLFILPLSQQLGSCWKKPTQDAAIVSKSNLNMCIGMESGSGGQPSPLDGRPRALPEMVEGEGFEMPGHCGAK